MIALAEFESTIVAKNASGSALCSANLKCRPTPNGTAYSTAALTVDGAYHAVTFDSDGGTITLDFAAAVAAYNGLVQAIRSNEDYYR